MTTFAQSLEILRQEHKLTQKELADIMGVSQTMVSNYINSDSEPAVGIIIKLARHFKRPVSYFYPDIGEVMQKETTATTSGTKIIDHLISENENLWEEKKTSSTKELKMLDMLQHFILKNAG